MFSEELVFQLGELFCGPGGLAWGATHAHVQGAKVVHKWSSDYDKSTCLTYTRNICPDKPSSVICQDVRTLDFDKLPKINAFAFGFPCNDFSIVGEHKGLDGKYGGLYQYGVKVLHIFKPDWFIAENVGGIRSSNKGKAFKIILDALEDSEYRLCANLYKFEDYGIPQTRHRVIIVGIRNNLALEFKVPKPNFINAHVASSKALMDIPDNVPNNEIGRDSARVIERLKYIKPGMNAFNSPIPPELALHVKGAKLSNIYKRLDPELPAYTVTGSGGGGTRMYHWSENRSLSNRERARLQTFPDDYEFMGSITEVRKQIGMAVPPVGAQIIVEAVLKTFMHIPYPFVPASLN